MTPEQFEASLEQLSQDGRKYGKVNKTTDLLAAKNQMLKAKKRDDGKCLAGGIVNHVDPDLRYLYVRSVATHKCFCLQIPEYDFWLLPRPVVRRPIVRQTKPPSSRKRKYAARSSSLRIAR